MVPNQQLLNLFLKSRKRDTTKKYTEKILEYLQKEKRWVRSHELLKGVNKSLKKQGNKTESIPESTFHKLLNDLKIVGIIQKKREKSCGVGGSEVSYKISIEYSPLWFFSRNALIEHSNQLLALLEFRRNDNNILK